MKGTIVAQISQIGQTLKVGENDFLVNLQEKKQLF